MAVHKVAMFRPYPFQAGQKIHIETGPRKGDWEVIGVSDRKVELRCPFHYESLSGPDSVILWKTVKSISGLRKIKWNFPLVLSMK